MGRSAFLFRERHRAAFLQCNGCWNQIAAEDGVEGCGNTVDVATINGAPRTWIDDDSFTRLPKFEGFADQLGIVNENCKTVIFGVHGSTDGGAIVVETGVEKSDFNPLGV